MGITDDHILTLARQRIEKRGKYPGSRAVALELQKLQVRFTDRGVSMKFPKEKVDKNQKS